MTEIIKKIIPFKKQIKEARFKIKKIRALLFFPKISNKYLLRILNKHNEKQVIQYFKKREIPKFFVDYQNKNEITKIYKEKFSNQIKDIIQNANEKCNHIFDLLGSGKINLGKNINWHCDFKSDYCWNPKTFYLDIKYGDKKGVDVKVPWELSRCQHFAVLGEAYWLTGDEKYAKEFVDEIEDWINNNPPLYGVNWRCTMDVAIRSCNWILGYYFFKNSKKLTDEFLIKFLKSLFIHGEYIRRNLEYSKALTSNHYLSDIVGLVYLGIFFKDIEQRQKWLKFAIQELKKEMEKQVYPDGCDFEASTCYHRLVLELFFFSTLLITINNKNFKGENYKEVSEKIFGKKYVKQLHKMFRAVLYLLKPNGEMPQIGDNDNGRLHIFSDRNTLDMRYLLTFGAILFKEPKFKIKEFGFCEEILWIFREKGYKIWQNLKENSISNIKSEAFSNAGWYIMRKGKNHMIISAGPNGQNSNGGHCHNDKLSFALCIEGQDIIVDPGTFVYTPFPDWRNKFRSTAYHNTVRIDRKEQNRFTKNHLFSLKNDAKIKVNQWEITQERDIFDAEHSGYTRLKNPATHRRQIIYNKKENSWIIKDLLTGKGEYQIDLYFHLSPDVKIIKNSKNKFIIQTKNNNNINLIITPTKIKNLKMFTQKSWYSPEYGSKIQSARIECFTISKLPIKIITKISIKK